MNSFARADLFFAITSGAVIVVTACLVVALIYLVSILHEVRSLVVLVRKEGELLSENLGDLRSHISREGFKWTFLFAFLRKLWKRRSSSRRKSSEEE